MVIWCVFVGGGMGIILVCCKIRYYHISAIEKIAFFVLVLG